jgi:uncharacterized BrkB/YihY/UPF0761 family membrane protein
VDSLAFNQSANDTFLHGEAIAASIVVVLIWVYYTSQIILMGAEITHSYAEHNGSIRPSS